MKTNVIASWLFIAGAFIAPCWSSIVRAADNAPAPKATASLSNDEKAIVAVFDDYCRTLKAGDAKAWLALWDENGIQLPPDEPMHVGKAAIAAANIPLIEKFKTSRFAMEIKSKELVVLSDGYAFETCVYAWEWTPEGPDAKPIRYDGKAFTLFKKQADGLWKIYRDTFNSNTHAP